MAELVRELGETLGFSIGTAVPIETHIMVEKPQIKTLWVNVETLFRNFYNSLADPEHANPNDILREFLLEVEDLAAILSGQSVEVFYYRTSPDAELSRMFKHAKIKVARTPKQLAFAAIENKTVNEAVKLLPPNSVKQFKIKLFGDINMETHILTHNPLDLISQYNFGRLLLVESHTGAIKEPHQWIAKIATKPEYERLPFNILTIQVLGDKGKQFLSMPPSVKKELLGIAAQGRWSPVTGMEKVRSDVMKYGLKNKEVFLSMLQTKYS